MGPQTTCDAREDGDEENLRVLLVEDDTSDAELMVAELRRSGHRIDWRRVDTEADYLDALDWPPEVILADLSLPQFSGCEALRILYERGDDVPLIIVSGTIGEDSAVSILRRGAADYLLKDRLTRLGTAVDQALEQRRLRGEARLSAQETARTMEMLQEVNEQRRRLLARLVTAQEREAERIAAEIHDDAIQAVTSVSLMLGLLARELTDRAQLDAVRQAERTLDFAISRLRNLRFDLRPAALDREGLAAALQEYLERMHDTSGVAYSMENHLAIQPPAEFRAILYRIAQEALSNARRHARASRIDVALEQRDGGFLVRIEDDGIGFSMDDEFESPMGNLGLAAIRERAELAGGWSRIRSQPGVGTRVEAWLPDHAKGLA